MNRTPETDRFFYKQGSWSDDTLNFCRKLERERNEAREQRDAWEKLAILNAEKLGALLFGEAEDAK